jgi:hypothetical protein
VEKKNMSFTKDGGLKVGVKERTNEQYEDKTQRHVTHAKTPAHCEGSD